jgi:LPXTG-site transpeptidase (sortase) family protein
MMRRLLLIAVLLCAAQPVAASESDPLGWLAIPDIALYSALYTAPIVDNYHVIGGGVYHLQGTTWPDDGWGRVVLAAHNPGKFGDLQQLRKGDRIVVITHTDTYEFEVTTMTVINSDESRRWLAPTDAYTLTLMTCLEVGVTWLAVDAKPVN